jgi:hypothetical protein
MSNLYGTTQITSIDEMANSEALLELYLVDDILNASSSDLQKFTESEEYKVLVEKGALDKKFIDRATVRKMDLHRRIKLSAYQMAKDTKDPNWDKLLKYAALKKSYAKKILSKFGKKAERIARISQKNYIKKAKSAAAKEEKK